MKTRIKFLACAVAVLLIACGNSQKDTSNNGTLQANGLAESDGTSGNYYTRDPGTNDKLLDNNSPHQSNNNSVDQQDPNRSQTQQNSNSAQDDYDRQRNQKMYSSLKMTDDQIQKYENASRTSMDTWKQNNKNKTMSAQDRVKLQNDNLKSILDETQYQNYEKWSTSNPYQN